MKFSVIGSCISRDLFPIDNQYYEFFTDIRFTSPYTLLSDPVPELNRIVMEDFQIDFKYATNWYKKNLCNDINKTAFKSLKEKHGEYLIIDLADSRIPILEVTFGNDDKKYYLSGSEPFIAAYESNLKFNKFTDATIKKVSPQSFPDEDWEMKIKKYTDEIKKIFPAEKIILIENYCADHYTDEQGILHKFVRPDFCAYIHHSKNLFKKLYKWFREYLPDCKKITIPPHALADTKNKWGLHPLHMNSDYYKYLLRCIGVITKDNVFDTSLDSLYKEYSKIFLNSYLLAASKKNLLEQCDINSLLYYDFNDEYSLINEKQNLHLVAASLIYKATPKDTILKKYHYGIPNAEINSVFSNSLNESFESIWLYPDSMQSNIFYVTDSMTIGKGAGEYEFYKIFSSNNLKTVLGLNLNLQNWWKKISIIHPNHCFEVTIDYRDQHEKLFMFSNVFDFTSKNQIARFFIDSKNTLIISFRKMS